MHSLCLKLRQLEEEIPEMHIVWQEELSEIHIQIMGEVQMDILKALILERFGVPVSFGEGSIVYMRRLPPRWREWDILSLLGIMWKSIFSWNRGREERDSQFAAECSEDMLDVNWQRLILTHLEEKKHRGVGTGSEITDMKITLLQDGPTRSIPEGDSPGYIPGSAPGTSESGKCSSGTGV